MKAIKRLFVLLFAIMLVIPSIVFAEDKQEEKKEPVKVYLFHGATCPHCLETIEWFDSIEEEYGKYFDLVKFEVWSNQTNSEFMQVVADKLGEDVGGVPFLIVGEYTFPDGFAPNAIVDSNGTTMAQDMINKIMDTYNAEDRYDVMDGLNMPTPDAEEEKEEEKNNDNIVAVVSILLIVGLGTVAVITRRNSK